MEFFEIQSQLTPGIQIETDWEGGLSGLPTTQKKLLLLGTNLSSGSIPVPTGTETSETKRITSVKKAIELWGKGSHLAVMAEAALRIAPRTPIYGVAYKQGVSAVAATGKVTLASNATGSGELKMWVCGRLFRVGIAKDDTPETVVNAMVAEINAHSNLPVLASATGAPVTEVTLTARNPGTAGNSIRYRSEITDGIGMTSTDAGAALTSGATDGDPSTQLAAMEGERWHLIALDVSDATALGAVQDHQEAQSKPSAKKWGLGIGASAGTSSEVQTLANGLDSYRIQIVWLQNSDAPVFELSAAFGAERSRYNAKVSLDSYVLRGIPAPYDTSVWPAPADIEESLEEGIVPLEPHRGSGKVTVVRSVVTRQTLPISFRDHTIAEKSDYTDETIIARASAYKGKTLKTASPPGHPETITPARFNAVVIDALLDLESDDYVQGVKAANKAKKNFTEPDEMDPDRLNTAFEFFPTRTAHGLMMKKTYVTQ